MNGFWDLERTDERTDESDFIGPISAPQRTKKGPKSQIWDFSREKKISSFFLRPKS